MFETDASNLPSALARHYVLALLVFLAALAGTGAGTVKASPQLLDRVVAIVNDDVVMQSELGRSMEEIKGRLRNRRTPLPADDVLRSQVLDKLILESIQLQLAEKAGIRVDDNQLNETMANIAKSNGMSLEEFESALRKEGLSYASARQQIKREMIISRIQQRQVDRRVRVTEQEVKSFLASAEGRKKTAAEYYLGHILIAVKDTAPKAEKEKARKRAEAVLAELKNGADFQQTAVARSDGRNALKGGIIGWRKENELPSIAADVVPNLAVGQPSELIESASGFHILAVIDKRGGSEQLVKQRHVRHILIKPTAIRSDAEAREQIDKLYDRISQGEDFAALAKSNSDDPGSAIDGGDLDWVNPGDMVPAFEQMMNQTPVGQVSKPFKSQFGWHILQVLEERTKDVGDLVHANQARQIIHKRKYEEELANWLLEIRGEAFVQKMLDADQSIENPPEKKPEQQTKNQPASQENQSR